MWYVSPLSHFYCACITDIQVVISPKNFFLFTPLLPSVAVGTLTSRAILQPTRYVTRHKAREVTVIEAEAREVDVSCHPPDPIHFPSSDRVIAKQENCHLHWCVMRLFLHVVLGLKLYSSQMTRANRLKRFRMIISSMPSGRKSRRSAPQEFRRRLAS